MGCLDSVYKSLLSTAHPAIRLILISTILRQQEGTGTCTPQFTRFTVLCANRYCVYMVECLYQPVNTSNKVNKPLCDITANHKRVNW